MNAKRLEISRLYHRFGFGPRPGQYAAALRSGAVELRKEVLAQTATTVTAPPVFADLGARPKPNTPEVIDFVLGLRQQSEELLLWWLDQMVESDSPLLERATWFWHGHWATSISKVNYPRPMYVQNETMRTNSLGDFTTMAESMLQDCALQFWLDGQVSTLKAPNENLAREFMELFTLGINRYSEDDVKALSKVFTGFQVNVSSGVTTFNPKRHDSSAVKLLGKTQVFTPAEAAKYLVTQPDCGLFLRERIWYRFISSSEKMPANFPAIKAFADRDINKAIAATMSSSTLANPKYELVKTPVEWFVAACRALELVPSQLQSSEQLINHLSKLGQLPFAPPNVGGWPAGEGWLSSASALYRVAFANWLIPQSQLRVIQETPITSRTAMSADWLGVPEWSSRTKAVLNDNASDPKQFVLMALCSPDYVVSR